VPARLGAQIYVNEQEANCSLLIVADCYYFVHYIHGRRQQGAWIFKHGTNEVERGFIVLFFGLVFYADTPLEIFLPTPLLH